MAAAAAITRAWTPAPAWPYAGLPLRADVWGIVDAAISFSNGLSGRSTAPERPVPQSRSRSSQDPHPWLTPDPFRRRPGDRLRLAVRGAHEPPSLNAPGIAWRYPRVSAGAVRAFHRTFLSRRNFLAASGAVAAASVLRPWRARAGPISDFRLVARPGRTHLVGEGYPETAVWSYNGTVPGPEIRVRQGERLHITVENQLDRGDDRPLARRAGAEPDGRRAAPDAAADRAR